MSYTIQIIIINVYWYCMKIMMFIYMKFFFRSVQYISILNERIKKCISNYQVKTLIINNSIITYDYCNSLGHTDLSYDYIVHREPDDNKTCMILTNNIEKIIKLKNKAIKLEQSNYEFIMVLLKCNDTSYDISTILKNPQHYYYVKDATLFNTNFIKWICLHHLKTTLDNPEIVIMDKSVKEFTLKPNQYIILEKDNYKIINELI